jgi:iron complex outermembrane receptor protein
LSGLTGAGNPLEPESARSRSFGVDLSPAALQGFSASLTYFSVDYAGQIGGILSNLNVLQNPATAAQYGGLIVFNPPASLLQSFLSQGYPVFGVAPNPLPVFIYGNSHNLGVTLTRGLDFQVSQKFGQFSAGINGSYLTKYRQAVTPSAELVDNLNVIGAPPQFRARARFGWQGSSIGVAGYLNYTGGYKNNFAIPTQNVASFTTLDLHVDYDVGAGLRASWAKDLVVALDVTNLLDTDPPFVNVAESQNGGGGWDPQSASPFGRVLGLSVRKQWH